MRRLLWSDTDWRVVRAHFEAAKPHEEAAFLLIRSGRTTHGRRMMVERVLLPSHDSFERQGHDYLRPTSKWISAVISAAVATGTGVAFIHSHPDEHHPAALSALDVETSITWGKTLGAIIPGPFASVVWSPAGMAGVILDEICEPVAIDSFESYGERSIELLNVDRFTSQDSDLDDRQARALTVLGNRRLRNMRLAIVGVGGTGSPLAEQLVRSGISEVVLVDPDRLDDPSNVRRVVGSTTQDLGAQKVSIVGRHLRSIGFSTDIVEIGQDVRYEHVIRRVLDCDLIISTTDTQSSRALINQVAYQYWIPTIDVGLRVGTTSAGQISGMPVEVRTLLPATGCLWCRKYVLSSQAIYEENLPSAEQRALQDEGYVQGVRGPQPSLTPLNSFAASVAFLTALRAYSGLEVPFMSVIIDPWDQFVHAMPTAVDAECVCAQWRGKGDDASVPFLPT